MLKERSKIRKVNHETYALVLKELLAGPCTVAELEAVSGLHHVTMLDFMRVLRRHGVVHIVAWEPDALGRDVFAVFALGKGTDAKRRKMTPAERSEAYRVRKTNKLLISCTTKGECNADEMAC